MSSRPYRRRFPAILSDPASPLFEWESERWSFCWYRGIVAAIGTVTNGDQTVVYTLEGERCEVIEHGSYDADVIEHGYFSFPERPDAIVPLVESEVDGSRTRRETVCPFVGRSA